MTILKTEGSGAYDVADCGCFCNGVKYKLIIPNTRKVAEDTNITFCQRCMDELANVILRHVDLKIIEGEVIRRVCEEKR